MWPLILLSYRAHFGLRKDAQSDQAGGDAEADDPVEQIEALSSWRGQCGVFAQKKGLSQVPKTLGRPRMNAAANIGAESGSQTP